MSSSSLPVFKVEWRDTHAPTNDELAAFAREASLSASDAEFLLERQQRPEIVFRPSYALILLYIPVFEKKTRVTSSATLAFVATEDTLYTLHYEPIVAVDKLRKEIEENPEKHEPYVGSSPLSLALYIIGQLNASSFRKLTRLAKHIDIAEDAVFYGNERKMVEEIAVLSRDVLDFRRIVRPLRDLFASLPEGEYDEETFSPWRRVHGQMRQMWEYLEGLHDSIEDLRTTNDSLLQHKENELLRVLSLYSIIAIPVWIFVGPYNPRGPDATAVDFFVFWVVLGLLIIWLLWIFVSAKRKKVI